jgi:hypothetical protein
MRPNPRSYAVVEDDSKPLLFDHPLAAEEVTLTAPQPRRPVRSIQRREASERARETARTTTPK